MYSNESDEDTAELEEEEMNEDGYSGESGREDMEEESRHTSVHGISSVNRSSVSEDYSGYDSRLVGGTPRGIKRSRGGAAIFRGTLHSDRKIRSRKQDSAVPTLVKNMASRLGIAHLDDPDRLILRTESIVNQLPYPDFVTEGQEQDKGAIISSVVEDLGRVWQNFADHGMEDVHMHGDYVFGIGPDENAPALSKALFLATLLLQLHHPASAKGKQASLLPLAHKSINLTKSSQQSGILLNPTALPKVFIDWLDNSYSPYKAATKSLFVYQPNPIASANFWDLVLSLTLRGQLSAVIKLFKISDFKKAWSAREDGQSNDGYQGIQLENTERVINRAIQLLEHCPGLLDDDWNVTGNDWRIFRHRVEQASEHLANLAEGHDRDLDPRDSTFEASNFGIKNPSTKLSRSSRQAESHVPWSIYQSLKTLYGVLLGGVAEIISCAQNWVEVTVGLTIWWDGDDDDDEFAAGRSAMSRRSLRHSFSRTARLVDINHTAAYLRRLAAAFGQATDDSDETWFQINPINVVEVGLACVCEGNVEGVLALLRGWSLPVASAVVQIASVGGWYNPPAGGGTSMAGFNESDLMVLTSYGQPDEGLTRDSILIEYGEALFDKDVLQDAEKRNFKEGWELSLSALIRLDDTIRASHIVGDLLSRIPLGSDQRVDKVIEICQEFNKEKEAEGIAEVSRGWCEKF